MQKLKLFELLMSIVSLTLRIVYIAILLWFILTAMAKKEHEPKSDTMASSSFEITSPICGLYAPTETDCQVTERLKKYADNANAEPLVISSFVVAA